jgi:hypothetical protein
MTDHADGRGPGEDDRTTLLAAVKKLEGQRCAEWRKGYGRSGSLHFGDLRPYAPSKKRRAYGTRGTWVLTLWNCDVELELATGERIETRGASDERAISRLATVNGQHLTHVRLDTETLALSLTFSSGDQLTVAPDATRDRNEDQWSLEPPDEAPFVAFGNGRWVQELTSE